MLKWFIAVSGNPRPSLETVSFFWQLSLCIYKKVKFASFRIYKEIPLRTGPRLYKLLWEFNCDWYIDTCMEDAIFWVGERKLLVVQQILDRFGSI